MDTEFHYYITGIIANAAGFTEAEAQTIAAASEFTDENDVIRTVKDRPTGEIYANYVSQTMNILKPKHDLMRIYPIFHFVPGEPTAECAVRRDGKMHLLNTTPDNPLANELIDEAFKVNDDTRLFRIGIAMHAYADTWAHQNFVGWYDYFNSNGLNLKPDIGHADAEHHPDWAGHRWDDGRLVHSEVDNILRFSAASERIFEKFSRCNGLKRKQIKQKWGKLSEKLLAAMGKSFSGFANCYQYERIKRYRELAPWLTEYDETDWETSAMVRDIGESLEEGCWIHCWRENVRKEETDWFLFQTAVKDHQAFCITKLEPLFKKMGIDIHDH